MMMDKDKYSIIENENLKLLKLEKLDVVVTILAVIMTFLITLAIAGIHATLLSLYISLLVACICTLSILVYKRHKFKKMHEQTPQKIDFINVHDSIIDFLSYAIPLKDIKVEKGKWNQQDLKDIAKRIEDEIKLATDLVENPPPAPDPEAPYLREIIDEKKKIYATWSNSPALWRDHMVIYYTIVNGIKNLIEYQRQHNGKFCISNKNEDKKQFFEEGINILDKISKGEDITNFFTLRFLILSEEDYESHADHVNSILRIHHDFRMHCIPLVKNRLKHLLSDEEKTHINNFYKSMHPETSESEDILYPDFLAVSQNVWWYEGPKRKNKQEYVVNAERIIKILASMYSEAKYQGYNEDVIRAVAVVK